MTQCSNRKVMRAAGGHRRQGALRAMAAFSARLHGGATLTELLYADKMARRKVPPCQQAFPLQPSAAASAAAAWWQGRA